MHLALLLAVGTVLVSINTFVSPLSAARMHGFDLERPDGGSTLLENPSIRFVPIFGGRNLAIALAMFSFYWQRNSKALGTLLICCIVSATVDIVVTNHVGIAETAWIHVIGAGVLGVLGLMLLG